MIADESVDKHATHVASDLRSRRYGHPSAPRPDLAGGSGKKTGLSKQTMSEVIRTLETAGWVRVKGIVSGKVGRSAVTYEVAPDAGFVIGMDIGATTIRVAIADIAGTIVHEVEKPAGEHGGEALLAHVSGIVEASLKRRGFPAARFCWPLWPCLASSILKPVGFRLRRTCQKLAVSM